MEDTKSIQDDKIGSVSAIGQLATIAAPLLYLLGRKYSSAYFDELGCGWVNSHLTIQETISYSLPVTLPILAASLLSLELFLNGTSHQVMKKGLMYISIIFLTVIVVASFFWSFNLINTLSKFTYYGFLISFGMYISHVFVAVKRNNAPNLTSGIAWLIGSLVVVYGSAATLGSVDASSSLEYPEKNFPLMRKGPDYGRPQTLRLITKVGDKYLIIVQARGEKSFQLESNIDSYTIYPLGRP
ncbi:MAG TPA: hypothetical protein VJU59_07045 [Paraburkholderia sp.]|uniref:hypothetical protein n=1 Tax=Paraburkholderia sp. TaxID=1926495 RepID=UPI002B4907A1|nr:hypothetical protein [Paraburkholderia sp.]HKR39429.1 hypothetical protein [Paraburkholderia sp.]